MKVLHLFFAGVVICVIVSFILLRRTGLQKHSVTSGSGGVSAGGVTPNKPGQLRAGASQAKQPRVVEWMFFGPKTGNATIVKPKTSIKIDPHLEYLKLVSQPGNTILAIGAPGKTNIVLSAGTVRLLDDPLIRVEMQIDSV
jgi:hypothetical protein